MSDYVRHTLQSVGFTQPTDEIVSQIDATAERVAQSGFFVHPHDAVDAFVAALRAYYPTRTSLEFMDAMHKLESQAGVTASEFDELSERFDQLFPTGLPPGVPGAPVLPGQNYPPPAPAGKQHREGSSERTTENHNPGHRVIDE